MNSKSFSQPPRITIAIDGQSSCGKSTLAKSLAQALQYMYIDTGAMYRAVTLYTMRHHLWNGDKLNEQELQAALPGIEITFLVNELGTGIRTYLNGEDVEEEIRDMAVSQRVSAVSALAFVREALIRQQRQLGRHGGIVMDGRDIGTTVFPHAELKLFVVADLEVRAERRFLELQQKGISVSRDEVLQNLKERDYLDSTRAISPLQQAPDAVLLDSTHLSINEQFQVALNLAEERIEQKRSSGSVEIDAESGFCFGVVTAIRKAEEELRVDPTELYCLGDIVHNKGEVDRLSKLGLHTINHDEFLSLKNKKVLFRAHGEPPSSYKHAQANNLTVVDATCPVVLKLQERIREAYLRHGAHAQIVILGKRGHAEVNGLVGQTDGVAIVVQNLEELSVLDFHKDIILFVQTTMGLDLFDSVVQYIREHISEGQKFLYYDTVCRQVAKRIPHIEEFAAKHDRIFFIAGRKSSNGHVLFARCAEVNPNSFFVAAPEELTYEMVPNGRESIGVCGATSTPLSQMEALKKRIEDFMERRKQDENS